MRREAEADAPVDTLRGERRRCPLEKSEFAADRLANHAARSSLPAGRPEEKMSFQSRPVCGWCHQQKDMSTGIYDDGEWMCGDCVSGYAT